MSKALAFLLNQSPVCDRSFSSDFVLFVTTAKQLVKQSAKQIPSAKFLKIRPQTMIMAMKIAVLLR